MSDMRAEIEQAAAARYDGLEHRAVVGMSREQERDLKTFISDIGGHVPSGFAEDVLDYDEHHFERAMLLIRGEVEPESDAEAKALERWRAKHSP